MNIYSIHIYTYHIHIETRTWSCNSKTLSRRRAKPLTMICVQCFSLSHHVMACRRSRSDTSDSGNKGTTTCGCRGFLQSLYLFGMVYMIYIYIFLIFCDFIHLATSIVHPWLSGPVQGLGSTSLFGIGSPYSTLNCIPTATATMVTLMNAILGTWGRCVHLRWKFLHPNHAMSQTKIGFPDLLSWA